MNLFCSTLDRSNFVLAGKAANFTFASRSKPN